MIKKLQDKIKKMSSTSSTLLKSHDKNNINNLKLSLGITISKPTDVLLTPKREVLKKRYKFATSTPKIKRTKQSKKQNDNLTTFGTNTNSYSSTPFNCEKIQVKEKARADYKFLYQVGSGGFGHVWKVEQKKSNRIYAMKQISKAKVLLKKSINSVINQRTILQQLNNPFIINMKSAFQDREYLYMVMEYLKGGDLRYHLCFYQPFNEEQTKFIVGCIVLSLEYIHKKRIIHRDLKPENLVFQESGYLRITDFGVARHLKENNSQQTSGTPGYMAPEVICRMNHSFEADFFALGVIIYEIVVGSRPYIGETRHAIRDKILAHQVKITDNKLPYGWDAASMDFINRLLKRNKQERLGFNGIQQIKKHEWLSSINWQRLSRKQMDPPFIPGIITQSVDYQKQMENTSQSLPNEQTEILLRTVEIQNLFKDYGQSKKLKQQSKS